MPALTLESIQKAYGGAPVLQDVSLTVEAGERLVLLGPSGCGKTTLLRLVAGFIAPDEGGIRIDGRLVSEAGRVRVPPEARAVGMVFQDLALWPHLSVQGNLAFGLKAQGVPPEERARRIREMLALVELGKRADAYPETLSGGEQQRVALARALVLRPTLLLMDEPLASLDEALSRRLRKEILRLHGELGFTLLYVTHRREEAADIATRTVHLQRDLAPH